MTGARGKFGPAPDLLAMVPDPDHLITGHKHVHQETEPLMNDLEAQRPRCHGPA
jgi:hypothetical protein